MNVQFSSNFFGITDGDTSKFHANLGTTFENDQFSINCPLGDCGMETAVNDDGSKLSFSMVISTNDQDQLSISDNGETINLYRGEKLKNSKNRKF